MLFCRCVSLSSSRCESFLRLASLGQGTILDRQVMASANCCYSQSFAQNFVIKFKTYFVIKFNFQSSSYV
jgi:hypothetical protein